jgi:hypothetical protein
MFAGRVIVIVGMIAFFGSLALSMRYQKTLPTESDPDEGRIYPMDDHGHIVFLNTDENRQFHSLLWGGWLTVAAGSAATGYGSYLRKKLTTEGNR